MRYFVGGFAITVGLIAIVFSDKLVQSSARARRNLVGSDKNAKGWDQYSAMLNRLVGGAMVLCGVLLLLGVFNVRP